MVNSVIQVTQNAFDSIPVKLLKLNIVLNYHANIIHNIKLRHCHNVHQATNCFLVRKFINRLVCWSNLNIKQDIGIERSSNGICMLHAKMFEDVCNAMTMIDENGMIQGINHNMKSNIIIYWSFNHLKNNLQVYNNVINSYFLSYT